VEPRSGCPINAAVEVLGDRWSMLVLRDVIFGDRRFFRALLTGSIEGIASNILADRLKRLIDAGILTRGTAARGQRARFSLTEAGIQTLPVIYALGNWGLDYLALVAALYAVGAKPRLSLVLLAYGAAAVLSMIPITPGGLGFVEAGLTATLIAAGVAGPDALLATLAYRVVSYWLPLPAGLGASVLFRRRYGRVDMGTAEDSDASSGSAAPTT